MKTGLKFLGYGVSTIILAIAGNYIYSILVESDLQFDIDAFGPSVGFICAFIPLILCPVLIFLPLFPLGLRGLVRWWADMKRAWRNEELEHFDEKDMDNYYE